MRRVAICQTVLCVGKRAKASVTYYGMVLCEHCAIRIVHEDEAWIEKMQKQIENKQEIIREIKAQIAKSKKKKGK